MSIETIRQLKKAHEDKKPRTRYINPKSEKRVIEEKEYLKKRAEFLKKHPTCEATIDCHFPCKHTATQIHHKAGRVGKNYLDVKTWLACCFKCHVWLELNPLQSKKLFLSNSRLKKA